jgi:hypothetical protein
MRMKKGMRIIIAIRMMGIVEKLEIKMRLWRIDGEKVWANSNKT